MDHPTKDKSNPASFSAPIEDVHEDVTKSVPYSQRAAARKAKTEGLKGRGKPLGGAEPIPQGHLAPLTMAKPDFGEEEPPPSALNPQEAPTQQSQQPLSGVGSAYAVNQRLASGELKNPISVAESKKTPPKTTGLSPGTVEALKQMDQSVKEETTQEMVEPPMQPPIATEEVEKQKLEESDKDLERIPLDVEGILNARNSLLSEERKNKIESRLDKLELADMITNKEITQTVPVVPGRFEVTLRTLSQRENLFCLQYVYEFPGSEMYINELHNTAKLVCSLVGINGAALPDHRKDVGTSGEAVDREEFEKKMNHITSFPVQLMADVSVQLIWFNARVNELFNMDNLKNG